MSTTTVSWERRLLLPAKDQPDGPAEPKVYSFYNILLEERIAPEGGTRGKWAIKNVRISYRGSCPVTLRLQKSVEGRPSLKPPLHSLSTEIEGTPSKGIDMQHSELIGGVSTALISQPGPFVIEGPAEADGAPLQDLVAGILYDAPCDVLNAMNMNAQGKSTWYGEWAISFSVAPFQASNAAGNFADRILSSDLLDSAKRIGSKVLKRGEKVLAAATSAGNFAQRMQAAKAAKAAAKFGTKGKIGAKGKFGKPAAKAKFGKKVSAKGKYGKARKIDINPKL